jgi:ABC-2 type transport system permease protein
MSMGILSKDILKQSISNNWKLWTAITGALCLLTVMATVVSNTVGSGDLPGPGGAGREFGLLDIYANMIFGMMGLLMMIIYAIVVGNKLVANEVDNGTMSFTLNTPITRNQIILSKALF